MMQHFAKLLSIIFFAFQMKMVSKVTYIIFFILSISMHFNNNYYDAIYTFTLVLMLRMLFFYIGGFNYIPEPILYLLN